MNRQEANLELLNHLEYLIERYPDMRFSQILLGFAFVKQERPAKPEVRISWQDEFYVEGEKILARVKQRIEDIETTNKQLEDKE